MVIGGSLKEREPRGLHDAYSLWQIEDNLTIERVKKIFKKNFCALFRHLTPTKMPEYSTIYSGIKKLKKVLAPYHREIKIVMEAERCFSCT
jgi:hypothetical protein